MGTQERAWWLLSLTEQMEEELGDSSSICISNFLIVFEFSALEIRYIAVIVIILVL